MIPSATTLGLLRERRMAPAEEGFLGLGAPAKVDLCIVGRHAQHVPPLLLTDAQWVLIAPDVAFW